MKRLKRQVHYKLSNLHEKIRALSSKTVISWLLVTSYCGVLAFLAAGPLMRVKTTTCDTNTKEPCPDFIIPELNKFMHELLYTIQRDEVEAKLSANLPQAKKIEVSLGWPNTLMADITWESGITNLSIPASSSAFLVGGSGEVLKYLDSPDPTLPTIIASQAADLIISDTITDPSLKTAVGLVSALQDTQNVISTIDVLSVDEIWINFQSGTRVIATSLKSVESQVQTLQLILSQATMKPELSIIDIRLDRPALKSIQ